MIAGRAFTDQFDARLLECSDEPYEAVDHPTHLSSARLHPLDRRNGEAGAGRQRFLIDAQKGPGRTDLC